MRIEKIEISNYKSVANSQVLSLHDKVTAVIGKNESGKSNVLDCIGNVSISSSDESYRRKMSQPSRYNLQDDTAVTLIFRIDEEERSKLNVQDKITIIQYRTNDTPFMGRIVQGFGKEYFENPDFGNKLDKIKEILANHFPLQHNLHKQIFNSALSALDDLAVIHNLKWKSQISFLFTLEKQIPNQEDAVLFRQQLEYIQRYSDRYYDIFPDIVYYTEQNLNSQYSFKKDDFDNLRTSHGEMLINFIKAAKFNENLFEEMMLTYDSGRKQDLIDDLKELIDAQINRQFNQFYPQEIVSIVPSVENSSLKFFVKSNSRNITISERSNGLKWYLNLFITLLSKNIQNKNILFVIDEPGVHLHVDAQKELRRLFYELPSNYQILYSTHSPFMISENHISDIKVIQKNQEGITEIVNSVFSENILQTTKKETLSPILKSIGMSQQYVFGAYPGKINVITEGITDSMYLRAMAKNLDENRFVFIPAIGASNIYNLGLILWGWGFKYICLYDFDSAGIREQKKAINKYGLENTISLSNVCDGEDITIEDLIDDADFELVDLKKELVKKSVSKMLEAKKLCHNLSSADVVISELTRNNFTVLFDLMEKSFVKN